MKSNGKTILKIIIILIVFVEAYRYLGTSENVPNVLKEKTINNKTFSILSSSENKDLENVIMDYANKKGYDIDIEYAGTLDIMNKLNQDSKDYDAVWTSNSIWLYMLNNSNLVKNSKYTSINPVIFAIKNSKAKELGFVGKDIKTQDIVDAISMGKLKFSMSNPTSTNSGASAYLGFLSTLAGNPEVLKEENLNDEQLKTKLKNLFTGLERTSGSEDFLEEIFLKSDYDAVVTYESSIININKKLENEGKETLLAVYPIDGVSISDSPFGYIDNKNDNKKEIFEDLQGYILSNEGQKLLQEKGRRTWYGGVNDNVDKKIFNPDWGIDTKKYITPVKYPSTKVIKQALNLYQTELRKPVHVAFCLDYSGSMSGNGYDELMDAMDYILTDKAANDFIQFSDKDKIDIIPFGTKVFDTVSTTNGLKTENLLVKIHDLKPSGMTALYPAGIRALEMLKDENQDEYNTSIVLMTDGLANQGTFKELREEYSKINKEIPIYSIMFGSADKDQLEDIAKLTNAKVFDGKTDLVKAFKEVRGYN